MEVWREKEEGVNYVIIISKNKVIKKYHKYIAYHKMSWRPTLPIFTFLSIYLSTCMSWFVSLLL